MEDLWGPIDQEHWRATPCISGRQATEQDVKDGLAVFYVNGSATPADFPLPACGLQRMEDGTEQPVVVIQAEAASRVGLIQALGRYSNVISI